VSTVGRAALLVITLAAPLGVACSSPEAARLAVDIAGPARAVPLVFHGNCQAGWQVSVDLRVRDTGDATVWLDRLDFAVVDVGQPRTVVDDSLDAAALASRYGVTQITAGLAVVLTIGGRSEGRPVGPVTVDGAAGGRDENGNRLIHPFHLTAAPLDLRDADPSAGGACGPRPDDTRSR